MSIRDFFSSPEEMELELRRMERTQGVVLKLPQRGPREIKAEEILYGDPLPDEKKLGRRVKYGKLVEREVAMLLPKARESRDSWEDEVDKTDIVQPGVYRQVKKVDGTFCKDLQEAIKLLEELFGKSLKAILERGKEYARGRHASFYLTLVHYGEEIINGEVRGVYHLFNFLVK